MSSIKFKVRQFSHARDLIVPFLGLLGGLAGAWGSFNLMSTTSGAERELVYGIVGMLGTALSYTYLGWFIRSRWEGFGWRTIKSGTVDTVEDLQAEFFSAATNAMNDSTAGHMEVVLPSGEKE